MLRRTPTGTPYPSFNIEYPLKDGGPWNEGVYENWSMILIRDDKNSPWLVYDQGY
ncbi:MAG: DUF4829 domain-containing protein [bacterium]